jgi:hypothetical protein
LHTKYGNGKNLPWLIEELVIKPHIPVFHKSAHRVDILERSAFTFGPEDGSYSWLRHLQTRRALLQTDWGAADYFQLRSYAGASRDSECAITALGGTGRSTCRL